MSTMSMIEGRFSMKCKGGYLKDVQNFVSEHPEIDFKDAATRALALASEFGELDIAKYLIEEHQADIHENGDIALCVATGGGHLDIVTYLVEECQAKINAVSEVALYHAVEEGHLNVVEYLLKRGVDYAYYQKGNENAYKICHKIAEIIEIKENTENTEKINSNVEKLRLHSSARPVRRRPAP